MIEGDALAIDEPPARPAHVVANLPYNVGTALLVRWLGGEAWPPRWKSLTLMFQQEVAERIVAKPGSGAYGRLAVLAQWRATAEAGDEGPPLRLRAAAQGDVGGRPHRARRRSPRASARRRSKRLTAAAFGQRRKMLRRSLAGLPGALEALEALGIDSERRAETLAVGDFVTMARAASSSAAAARRRGRRALLGPLRREHLGGRAALDHGGELLRLRAGVAAAQGLHPLQVAPRALDRAALDIGLALAGERVDVVRLEPQRIGIIAHRLAGQALRLGDAAERDIGAAIAADRRRARSRAGRSPRRSGRRRSAPGPAATSAVERGSIWSSGRWPWPALAMVAAAIATERTIGVRRIKNSILPVARRLARPSPARDEKAVGPVPGRAEQQARARRRARP